MVSIAYQLVRAVSINRLGSLHPDTYFRRAFQTFESNVSIVLGLVPPQKLLPMNVIICIG